MIVKKSRNRKIPASFYRNRYCSSMNLEVGSQAYLVVMNLSREKYNTLIRIVGAEDDLLHIDDHGFTVNHGSVGSRGISYDFD